MKDPLGVSPSKLNQGTTRSKEKVILTSVGIESAATVDDDVYPGTKHNGISVFSLFLLEIMESKLNRSNIFWD